MSTTHKVWLITGCSTGLGRALAEAVLKHGDRLVATARNVDTLTALNSIVISPSQLLIVKLDVTKNSDVQEAFQQAIKHFGRVDVVVNNAGYGTFGEFESLTEDVINHQLDVNLHGVLRVSKEAVRVFREVNVPVGGRLLQITSVGGFQGFPGGSIYTASKFAVEGFSESLAMELKPEWNIKVTSIRPGGFRTDFQSRSLVTTTPLPAYEGSTAHAMRKLVQTIADQLEGDPAKAALAMIKVANEDNPPLRLALGKDSYGMIAAKLNTLKAELEQWQELTTSTSFETYYELKHEELGLK